MHDDSIDYDLAVVGGGLAGLATTIRMATLGYRVILFEKEVYPFHKVCGEYISMESKALLISLGLPLETLELPVIRSLVLSSPGGSTLQQPLLSGGFGISRYKIDHLLAGIAKEKGAVVMDGTRVQDIHYIEDGFSVIAENFTVKTRLCCAAYGKRSNLDVKWKRPFTRDKPDARHHYIGVKYHAITDHPRDTIALHNFHGGYCGIAPVEDHKTCICYLTTASTLQTHGNNIGRMEEEVLFSNPHLKNYFTKTKFQTSQPLVISQVSFAKKEQLMQHVLLLGDAAGLIAPLCGNGMSMALHSSSLAVDSMLPFLQGRGGRASMEYAYASQWKSVFSNRLLAGRLIQHVFGNPWAANTAVRTLRHFPTLVDRIIRQTHG